MWVLDTGGEFDTMDDANAGSYNLGRMKTAALQNNASCQVIDKLCTTLFNNANRLIRIRITICSCFQLSNNNVGWNPHLDQLALYHTSAASVAVSCQIYSLGNF